LQVIVSTILQAQKQLPPWEEKFLEAFALQLITLDRWFIKPIKEQKFQ
jgi:hypothetical protein